MEATNTVRLTPRPRHSPAREVQEDIRGLESIIDDAIAGGGGLLQRMVLVGKSAKVPPASSQAAIERAIACLDAGSTMRARALALHDDLRTISGEIDLRELGFGDLVNSPKTAHAPNEASATITPAG